MDFFQWLVLVVMLILAILAAGLYTLIVKCYRKVEQGTALILTGGTEPTVHFSRAIVVPFVRQAEIMDISIRRIEIFRHGCEGLICRDNVRADIKVAFFVRVNNTADDVLKVAQSIGARRASEVDKLVELFDSKFSEALKTVGKQFDFVELYTSRERFKEEILKIIGRDLNGYILDDAAIDYLEQTPVEKLDPNNILDAEGIKKITDLTAQQMILANQIRREKEKTIKKQDVVAREAILELERQQAEAEERQHREIATVAAREQAEARKIQEEERLKAERARIATEEEVAVAEENKRRQVLVAMRSRERTDAVEVERVERDRQLEATERQRVVTLADIAKEKAIEQERRAIQDVIRERVMVERAVVEEQERIKDTQEFATAERAKKVAITQAEQEAQEALVKQIKSAEAARDASRFQAEQELIAAEAKRNAAEKAAAAKKILAEGVIIEEAALGTAEATVIERKALAEAKGLEAKAAAMEKQGTADAAVLERKALAEAKGLEAKAAAMEKQGTADAAVLERKALAEAKGLEAKAAATEKQGTADAAVLERKALAEAKGLEARAEATQRQGEAEAVALQARLAAEASGITEKAEAMKLYNEAGKEHEEFKLRLEKEKAVELAAIDAQREIAEQQGSIMAKAMESAHIDIVGGEAAFFDRITNAIAGGKTIDRFVDNSQVLTDIKGALLNGSGNGRQFQERLREFISQFKLTSEDVKNLSIAALIGKMMGMTAEEGMRKELESLLGAFRTAGLSDNPAAMLSLK